MFAVHPDDAAHCGWEFDQLCSLGTYCIFGKYLLVELNVQIRVSFTTCMIWYPYIFSRKSDSTITNVCLSVSQQNPSTAWYHHPLSFIILHSSFIIIHSSFLYFATFKLFSLLLSRRKAGIQSTCFCGQWIKMKD